MFQEATQIAVIIDKAMKEKEKEKEKEANKQVEQMQIIDNGKLGGPASNEIYLEYATTL